MITLPYLKRKNRNTVFSIYWFMLLLFLIPLQGCVKDLLSDLSRDNPCDRRAENYNGAASPVPNFSYQINGNTVSFINVSIGADTYQWTLGDGTVDTLTNVVHTYPPAETANYAVILEAQNACDTIRITKEILIAPDCPLPPQAEFNYAMPEDKKVQFQNISINASSYLWDFGDGDTATEPAPLHIYDGFGTYSVSLTAINNCGEVTTTYQLIVISCVEHPLPSFTYIQNGNIISFTNNSQHCDSYSWNYGDGSMGNEETPVHSYTEDGTYLVSLLGSNECEKAWYSAYIIIGTGLSSYDCPILMMDIGALCDDENGLTINDSITTSCNCAGNMIDCRARDSILVREILMNYNNVACGNWDINTSPLDQWCGIGLDENGCVDSLYIDGDFLSEKFNSFPQNILQLTELNHLDLYDIFSDQITGITIPSELGNLQNLENLILSFNPLIGSIPPELGNLENLEYLELYNNQLTGSIPPELGNLDNLQDLWLYNNQLTGSIPPELGNLGNLTQLFLYGNELTSSIPPELGNLENLYSLRLDGNQLTGNIPPELENLENLKELRLSRNQLTGSIPSELGNLGNLQSLHLWNNQLTGSLPLELGNLENLTSLLLFNNQLTGSIPPELGNLENLISLGLGGNQLTGSIPPELGNLENLTSLGLDDNQLTGSIPPELGNLLNLTKLNLSSNQLTGSIPPELGNLENLESMTISSDLIYGLDLSDNQLSGCIPNELNTFCPFYLDLDLSNNPGLPWGGNSANFCNGMNQIGAPCNDGNPNTSNDVITINCTCAGN